MESMAGIFVVLIMAVMPALFQVSKSCKDRQGRKEKKKEKGGEEGRDKTHKIPQLMATATPIFSLRFICRPQMSFHGSSARLRSMSAEYAAEKML